MKGALCVFSDRGGCWLVCDVTMTGSVGSCMSPVCPTALAQCGLLVTATAALDISRVVTAVCGIPLCAPCFESHSQVLWFNPAGSLALQSCSLTAPQRDGEENWEKVKPTG